MDALTLSDGEFGVTFCQPMRDKDGWLDSFVVHIEEPGLNAMARVINSEFIQGPEVLFSDMAQNWRGWSGEKTWHALNGELILAATTDSLGHITIRVQLQPTAGPESWRVVAHAYAEAGGLDSLSARATKFFGREP
jgi:hypothetical protein